MNALKGMEPGALSWPRAVTWQCSVSMQGRKLQACQYVIAPVSPRLLVPNGNLQQSRENFTMSAPHGKEACVRDTVPVA